MSDEHPDLIRLRERERKAIEQGYSTGDVNHFTQPIIGLLRRRLEADRPLSRDEIEHAVDRLTKACNAELAWLHGAGEL